MVEGAPEVDVTGGVNVRLVKNLTVDEASEVLGHDRRTTYRWIGDGRIPAAAVVVVGGKRRLDRCRIVALARGLGLAPPCDFCGVEGVCPRANP